jgi:hypothetical protein
LARLTLVGRHVLVANALSHYRKSIDFRLPKATENKGNPTKNSLFLAVLAYFRWLLAVENISLKIDLIFGGFH